jgi:CRP-like cAMP-binding protein
LRVESLQPSTTLVLGWEDFEKLVFRNPEVAIKTIRLLSERLAVCEGRLSDLIRKQVIARLAGLILSLSEHQGVITRDVAASTVRLRNMGGWSISSAGSCS